MNVTSMILCVVLAIICTCTYSEACTCNPEPTHPQAYFCGSGQSFGMSLSFYESKVNIILISLLITKKIKEKHSELLFIRYLKLYIAGTIIFEIEIKLVCR